MITYLFAGFPPMAGNRRRRALTRMSLADTLKVLNRISAHGEGDGDGDSAITAILRDVCAYTGWPIGHLYERDPDRPHLIVSRRIWNLADELDVDATAAFRELSEKTAFEDGKGLIGGIAADGEARAVPDVTALDQFLRADAARRNGVKGFFGFPVTVRGQVVAVAEFFSHDPAELDTLSLELMRNVAGHIARILERERAQRLERERAREQQALLRKRFEDHVRSSLDRLAVAADGLGAVAGSLNGATLSASDACNAVETLSGAAVEASERVAQSSLAIDAAAADLAARLDESVTASETVGQQTRHAGGMVAELEQAAGAVGGIAGLVATITGQIRMLGLNAAIEAVRAGEHGRGFGVVASEIKSLSEQSEEATRQIARQVQAMHTTVRDAAGVLTRLEGEGANLSDRTAAMAARVSDQKAATATIAESADGSSGMLMELREMTTALRGAMRGVGEQADALNAVAAAVAATAQALDRDSTAFLDALDEI